LTIDADGKRSPPLLREKRKRKLTRDKKKKKKNKKMGVCERQGGSCVGESGRKGGALERKSIPKPGGRKSSEKTVMACNLSARRRRDPDLL